MNGKSLFLQSLLACGLTAATLPGVMAYTHGSLAAAVADGVGCGLIAVLIASR
jgi:hypothetical protein